MNTTTRRKQESRVLAESGLSLLQEDALIGLMYEDFNRNRMRSLDYDKVRRFAFSIQTEPSICVSLDAEPCGEGEAWEPQDEWITSMCQAFINAAADEKKAKQQERQSAFGGGRDAYDPKNPHRRAGSATAKRPATNRAATTQRSSPQNATARKLAAKSVVKKLADPTNVEKIAVGALNISDPIPA